MSIDQIIEGLKKGGVNECMLWSDPSLGIKLSSHDLGRLCEALDANGKVHTLSLSGNTLEEEAASLLSKYLSTATSLRVVDLSFCGLNSSDLRKVVQALVANKRLESVLLNASYNNVTSEGASALAETLGKARDGNPLKHLVLRYNPLHTSGVASLVTATRHMESMDCSYTTLQPPLDELVKALSTTPLKTVRLCGLDLGQQDTVAISDAVPAWCTLLLDEDSPKYPQTQTNTATHAATSRGMTSPVATSPIARDVEELLWQEELALLHGTKQRRSKSRSASGSPGKKYGVEASPTASSPPPAAASPVVPRRSSRERSQPRCSTGSISSSGAHNSNEVIEEQCLPPVHSKQKPRGCVQVPRSGSTDASESSLPSNPTSSGASDPTLRSLSLALNVLHDNHASVTCERDVLRHELEKEVKRRQAAENEVQKLRRELELLRMTAGQNSNRFTHSSSYTGAQVQPHGPSTPSASHYARAECSGRDPSPQPRPRHSSGLRSISPKTGRGGNVAKKEYGDKLNQGVKLPTKSPTKLIRGHKSDSKSPSLQPRSPPRATNVLARNSAKRRYILARNN